MCCGCSCVGFAWFIIALGGFTCVCPASVDGRCCGCACVGFAGVELGGFACYCFPCVCLASVDGSCYGCAFVGFACVGFPWFVIEFGG